MGRSRLARRSTLDAESELSDSTESDRSRWLASSSESKLSCPLLHSFVYSFASSFALFEGWKAKGEACGTKLQPVPKLPRSQTWPWRQRQVRSPSKLQLSLEK